MYYYGARYYDPRISIFVSVDPLAEEFVGWTTYHYVHQNPINLIDPTEMSAEGPDDGNKERASWASRAWSEVKSWFGGKNYVLIIDEPVLESWDYGTSVPWVECHHTTGQDMQTSPVRNPRNILDVKEGVTLWGEGGLSANNLLAENKRGKILLSLDLGNVSSRSSAGGSGSKWFYEFLSGMGAREDDFKNGGRLFKTDKVIKHSYKGFVVGRPAFSDRPFSAMPITRDTILRESQINNTDWNRVSTIDSLRRAQTSKRLNK